MADWSDGDRNDVDCVIPAVSFTETSREALNEVFARLDVPARLALLARQIAGPVVFTTSFGLEDQALTHLIKESGIDCRFVTLDTGRLFPGNVYGLGRNRTAIRYPGASVQSTL